MPIDATLTFSLKLVKWLCKNDLVEEIQGNLEEYYLLLRTEKKSFFFVRYWYQVLHYMRPSFLQLFKLKNKGPMFNFNPKIAIRNLMNHRSTTIISLLGFVVGLTSVIFLYFYIENELNTDSFHIDKDQIYRVVRMASNNTGDVYPVSPTSGPYAGALANDFPETVQSTNRVLFERGLVTFEDKSFYEEDIVFADANFFTFFSYPLKKGNPATVLSGANDVVISQKIAEKYFGDEDPIGKILDIDAGDYKYTVSGVFDDFPTKSHLRFDMVFSIDLFDSFEWFGRWFNHGLCTYIKVNTPAEADYLESQFPDFMNKYMGEDFKRLGTQWGIKLESLGDLYFNEIRFEFPDIKHGSTVNVITLGSIALAILFIACFNYINLSIAQSYKRAKEVGVRKVLGVDQGRLIAQFLGESLVILLISVLASILLSELLKGSFNQFFDLNVIFNWQDPLVIVFFSSLFIVIVIASGLYPALLLSSFHPLKVLKTGKPALGKNIIVRKGLVILQFSMSIFLIIATSLIYMQLSFVQNRDLGFDKEAVLIIESNNAPIGENHETFKDLLKSSRFVKSVTSASGEPGGFHDNAPIEIDGIEEPVHLNTIFADTEYLKTFDISLVAGRAFDSNISSDNESVMMINESAVKSTGLSAEDIIGKKVRGSFWNLDHRIIGVFKDYHFKGLKTEIEPLVIISGDDDARIFAAKIDANNLSESVKEVEDIYKRISPNFPMSSRFLDDSIAQQYEEEAKQARIFTGFAILSIFLACMGIFGLASFSAQQRQKELSIRKVLGASVKQVIYLISNEFLVLVLISSLMAIPFSWYFVSGWLDGFAYRIELLNSWPIFLLGGAITAVVAFITIGAKTYKTAASNPSEIMRYE
ncbi:ABC transporter permease [Ekhidna sp.]